MVRPRSVQVALGQRYGRGVVEREVQLRGRRYVQMRCDCGDAYQVRLDHVTSGHTLSCGCLGREASSARLAASNRARETGVYGSLRKQKLGVDVGQP